MSKKDEKDINISKLDKSLEGQGLLEDADDAEYERTLAQQRREAEERERQVLEQAEAERREREGFAGLSDPEPDDRGVYGYRRRDQCAVEQKSGRKEL